MADAATRRRETVVLIGSLVASVAFGLLGIGWGILSSSRIILFDGVYALFGTTLTGVSIIAGHAAGRAPTKSFPYGLAVLVPIAVLIQGAALLGALVYAATDAVSSLVEGGAAVSALNVGLYGLVSAIGGVVLSLWLTARAEISDLVHAEAQQWRASAVLSVVIVVGAGAALVLEWAGVHAIAPYVDPVLVLVVVALLVRVPLGMIRDALREILEAAPPAGLRATIDAAIGTVQQRFGLPEPTVRATKTGGRVYLDVVFVVEHGQWDIDGEDRVRRAIIAELEDDHYELWANIELTSDPRIAD